MLRKLKIKFVCINMLIVTVLMCVILGMVIDSTRAGMEMESHRVLERFSSPPDKSETGIPKPPDILRLPHIILQYDDSGKFRASGNTIYDLEDEDFIAEIGRIAENTDERFGTVEKYALRFTRMPGQERKYVFVDISGERAMLAQLCKNSVLIALLGFFVFLGISIILANWAVKPVDRAWREQREFVADASHELKTPLTVITSNAELLCQEAAAADKAKYSDNILIMARKMRSLLERMLELARADNGQLEINFERLDMSALCADAVLPFEPLYFEKGLILDSAIDERVFIRGSAPHIRQLMDILLDNAQKYSLVPGNVKLRLKKQGSACIVTVENPSDEISAEDRKNIFHRFYRLDKARSSDGSYGLGLSIAESIVKEHKGRIRCDWEKGVARFTVTLPLIQ